MKWEHCVVYGYKQPELPACIYEYLYHCGIQLHHYRILYPVGILLLFQTAF